ncbi:MAG: LVIVD repeat-containing protein [Actinomycetota bacterium]
MRRTVMLVLVVALIAPVSATRAAEPQQANNAQAPPAGSIENVEFVANLPEPKEATAINFMSYDERDVMFVTGRFGLMSYDLTDPRNPRLLDHLGNDSLMLPGDVTGTYWQNEDMDLDSKRKLVFLARDPRAYDGTTSDPDSVSGVYIVNARNPEALELTTFHELPAGHTSSCVNDCRYLWTGGPAKRADMPADWGGRPIWVTDIRDPNHPTTFPDPVDTGRNDGRTDYSHDVQVDQMGVAWVSGAGGVRGYFTKGRHWDPVEERQRVARAWDPIPYGGGGFEESRVPSKFMHNSERPLSAPPTGDFEPGELLYATEESFQAGCADDGVFAIASLEGSLDGQAWRSTPEDPFRLKTIGTWSVADKEGSSTSEDCSAHYFDVQGDLVVYSWYSQGTRFLDVSDPTDPIQVGYFRPDDGRTWASYFHRGYVYVADHSRGVDVIRLAPEGEAAAERHQEVLAPPLPADVSNQVRKGFVPDEAFGWACRISV